MMLRIKIFCLLSWLFVSPLIGQNFSATLTGGINLSQIDGDGSSGFNKLGLNAGIRADYKPFEQKYTSLGLMLSQRGSTIPFGQGAFSDLGKIHLTFAEIPLMFYFNGWPYENYYKVGWALGLSYGRLVHFSTNFSEWESMESLLNPNDLCLKSQIHYHINAKVRLEFLFNHSLIRILSAQEAAGFGFPFRLLSYHLTCQISYVL
jgi:hypothetical protein